jgi:hypothetical protein
MIASGTFMLVNPSVETFRRRKLSGFYLDVVGMGCQQFIIFRCRMVLLGENVHYNINTQTKGKLNNALRLDKVLTEDWSASLSSSET